MIAEAEEETKVKPDPEPAQKIEEDKSSGMAQEVTEQLKENVKKATKTARAGFIFQKVLDFKRDLYYNNRATVISAVGVLKTGMIFLLGHAAVGPVRQGAVNHVRRETEQH